MHACTDITIYVRMYRQDRYVDRQMLTTLQLVYVFDALGMLFNVTTGRRDCPQTKGQ